MAEVLDEAEPARDSERHARWVRVSHWIMTVSLLTLAFSGFVILMAHPRLYWGDAGQRPHAGARRAADQPELPPWRLGQAHALLPEQPRGRSAPAGPTTSSTRTAGGGACTSSPRGASCCPAPCTCWPASSAVTSARTSGRGPAELAPRLVWRDVVDHLRFRIPPAERWSALRPAAEVRVLVRGLRGGAADGGDRPDDVAGGDRRHFRFCCACSAATSPPARSISSPSSRSLLFVLVHVVMVVRSGFRRQIRAMTVGE